MREEFEGVEAGRKGKEKNEKDKMMGFSCSEATAFVVCVEEPLITAPHGHSAWPLKCFEVHHPMKRA